MTHLRASAYFTILLISVITLSCTKKEAPEEAAESSRESRQDTTDILTSITGFSGPESVRYDPEQDVYFVSNFNGSGGERDSNGFISKVSVGGSMDSLQFMTGTKAHPLHAPRGMYISGDTLWAADIDGVHGFNRMTGEQLAFIDFSNFDHGFLNDVAEGAGGHLYVTDTGKSAVYKVNNGIPSVFVDSLPSPPNGITVNPQNNELVLAPWNGGSTFYSFSDDNPDYHTFTETKSGGNFDGIEFANGYLIAASQNDSSLYAFKDGTGRNIIHTTGRPADIGIDTKRMRVAVPYIALNRVDIWQLPKN